MKYISVALGLLLIYLSFFPHNSFAVTTVISNIPPMIGQEPFAVTVTVTGAKAARNYLRVDIYKQGTTEYRGQTHNNIDWYDGEDATQYFPIDITGSEANVATVSARMSTFPVTWSTADVFMLRVRRYTASGNYTATEADGSAVPVTLIIPSPTPTSIPTPTPTPTSGVVQSVATAYSVITLSPAPTRVPTETVLNYTTPEVVSPTPIFIRTVSRPTISRSFVGHDNPKPTSLKPPFDPPPGPLVTWRLRPFIKTTASAAGGISLLNIAYILYRMMKWRLRKTSFSTGFPS